MGSKVRSGAFCGVILSLSLASAASAATTNLLVNGGLETTIKSNRFGLVYASPTLNAHALNGWTITQGTIDIAPKLYWTPSQGKYSVDLIGTPGLGGIEQTVDTEPGTEYTLTFDFSINPDKRIKKFNERLTVKQLSVDIIDPTGEGDTEIIPTETFTGLAGTRTRRKMQYLAKSITFTATGDQTTIRFAATLPQGLPATLSGATSQCGPVLDNVVLFESGGGEVPEPASLSILGVGGLLMLRRPKRRSA
jgi:hypothetical protein